MNSRMNQVARTALAGLLVLTVVSPAAGQKKYGLDLGWKNEPPAAPAPAPAPAPTPKAKAVISSAPAVAKVASAAVSRPTPPEARSPESAAPIAVLAESMARLLTRVEELIVRVNRIDPPTGPASPAQPTQIASAAPIRVEETHAAALPVLAPPSPAPETSIVSHKASIVHKPSTVPRFEFQTITFSSRYRYVENSKGVATNNQLQNGVSLKFRSKIDRAGKYTVNAGLYTGSGFTSGWNNTGAGTGDLTTNLYLKQLFFEAKPIKGLQLQVGSLGMLRGESTEITTYDSDAYITGERLSIKQPKRFWFDEVAVTYAYLGDLNTPQAYKRFDRLAESNYHQFLVARKVGRVGFSADYTFQSGVETLREAAKVDTKGTGVADWIQFEAYQRLDKKPASGFAFYGERSITRKIKAGAGYASIDPDYGGLNGDKFNKGKRAYVSSTFALTSELSVSTFFQQAVGNAFPVSNGQRVDVVVNYNVLKRLQSAKIPGFASR